MPYSSCHPFGSVLLCRYMDTQLEQMLSEARASVSAMRAGAVSYDECKAVVSRYISEANVRGKEIAKRFGMRYKPLSVTAFMR